MTRPTTKPRNPNPFTERRIRLIQAIANKLSDIDQPEEVILPDRYEWTVESIAQFGKLPKLRFSPRANHIKAEIMRDAGLVESLSEKRKQQLKDIRDRFAPHIANRKEEAILADLFNKEWDNLMFAFKRAVFTSGYLNHVFAKPTQPLSDPAKLMQAIVKEEYGAVIGGKLVR